MRFVEFLTEGISKPTYRNRRVYPVDARWAELQFKKVDAKGQHKWVAKSKDPKVKTITDRQLIALIDFAQDKDNKDHYGWTYQSTPTPFGEKDIDLFFVAWTEAPEEMVEFDPAN